MELPSRFQGHSLARAALINCGAGVIERTGDGEGA
jgi:hypothetical protein